MTSKPLHIVFPPYFAEVREDRWKNCNGNDCDDSYRDVRFNCNCCQYLRSMLHRMYHDIGHELDRECKKRGTSVAKIADLASHELEVRLLFCYVFGIIIEEDFENGDWIALMDFSHRQRHRMLYKWTVFEDQSNYINILDLARPCKKRKSRRKR